MFSYVDALVAPYAQGANSGYRQLGSIADTIEAAVDPPSGGTATADIFTFFADVGELLGEMEVNAAGPIAAMIFLGMDTYALTADGPTVDWGDRVQAAAKQLGGVMQKQASNLASRKERIRDILVAAYAKLSTVGALGGCAPGPGCPAEWQFTQDDQTNARKIYALNAQRGTWAALLPVAYPYLLTMSSNPKEWKAFEYDGSQRTPRGLICDPREFKAPFVDVARFGYLQYGVQQRNATRFLVMAQANQKGAGGNGYPSASLLRPLFTPLDPGGDTTKGGLAMDQWRFMIRNWPAQSSPPRTVAWRGCGGL